LFHKRTAQNYLPIRPQELVVIDFFDLLIKELKKNYPELMKFTSLEWERYVIFAYLDRLSRFDASRYVHKDTEKIFADMMNFEFA
jgi:hypothetical protein